MAKIGSPTPFNRVVAALIVHLFREGLNRTEISKKAGVDPTTIKEWEKKNKDFSLAISKATDEYFLIGPEESMKILIKGYKLETITTYQKIDEETGKWVDCKRSVESKDIGPDYNAIRFCLQNRHRKKWNRKQNNFTVDVTKLSDKDLIGLTKEAIKAVEGK